ncbi:flavin reductase (DIM6/NTAB) family NADH-FMN oxidoreductase RutF [Spinactinospora alkalitolerans]|uniref:Flavin reductase (DIM6/NTAB) family NADH-FMN oxidoreductase RutF n=1 Tax=Spinactinospora alkalitolerans TaxID=687207 RepID=A0A852TZH4_9ACTN|nr:flavin reductase family protein [Spinactinospora alkalitolerans]NYE47180.1 flavin reductase (DIM6/NTAB) family NADH-FMN oxidoreductase RutF [Spinactinospora alkalitolerans]
MSKSTPVTAIAPPDRTRKEWPKHSAPATIDPARFRDVLGHYPTGIVVITAMHEQAPVGMAVGSFTSVSLTPALVGFFATRESTTWPKVREAGTFCVNVLGEEHQDICRLFATRGADKFAGLGWEPGDSGAPILDDAAAWIDCRLDRAEELGDHYLALGRVVDLGAKRASGPLIFYRGDYGGYRRRSAVNGPPAAGAAGR